MHTKFYANVTCKLVFHLNHTRRIVEFLFVLDPVYTVPDPYGHDIKSDSFYMNVALIFTIILQNLITTNYGKKGDSNSDRKLAEIDAGEYMNSVPFKRGLRGCSFASYKGLNIQGN